MRLTLPLVFVALWPAWLPSARALGTVPYPEALAAAAVSEDTISDISKRGIVVGNGELNAIIYSAGNDLHLRIAKNDCWDMRVNTKTDPPLPEIDVAAGKTTGHGAADSWQLYEFPTALPCAELILGGQGQTAVTNATLDLAKAVATIKTSGDSTDVRVLSQGNVILIHSARPLTFSGIVEFLKGKARKSKPELDQWVSKADQGTEGAYTFLHQNIPGDQDVSGMDLYLVAGKKDNLQAVAVVTSRDSQQPLKDAVALVASTLADATAIPKHEAGWQDFWSKSGIQLGDVEMQNWWYRMVYFYHVFSRGGGNAIGLAACFDHLAGWHNSLKLNYNIQQTYTAAGPINHPELLEPFIDVLNRNLPRAKWFAATSFKGASGAFFHSDLWPFEPDPAKCITPCKHQTAYLPYGYSWGMDGHTAVVLWDYYKFAPSPAHLDRIYPLIKEFGTFYWSILKECQLVDGKRVMGPSYFPERGAFGEFNVCYDIHFVTAALRIAREAALLKKDTSFVAQIDQVIDQVPSYGTQRDPDQGGQTVIEPWKGAKFDLGGDRHGTMVQGIFPAGVINWFSSDELKELGKRTINRVEKSTTHANSNVTINIARARLGLGGEAITNAKMCFSSGPAGKYSKEQPNGLFYWNGHGFYITEQVAIARLVTELLLQSVNDVIRIFPAWPPGTDAHFTNLLAQGGFEVSADQIRGAVTNVKIHSTVGGVVKLVSPWNRAFTVTEQVSNANIPVDTTANVATFPTTAGKIYLLRTAD